MKKLYRLTEVILFILIPFAFLLDSPFYVFFDKTYLSEYLSQALIKLETLLNDE